MVFEEKLEVYRDYINKNLDNYIRDVDCVENKIYKATRYSLLSKGKRIRPILTLAVGEMFGVKKEDIIPFACAIEMIHAYSLIHDDLPAMDNDDYRRGRLTNHKVFGEAIAILAGDALLNRAFEIMSNEIINKIPDNYNEILAMNCIVNAAGMRGMIAGQVIDMEKEGKDISLAMLEYMHERKTGCLIKAAILAGAHLGKAENKQMESLSKFARNLGIAFQIRDDILDVVGNNEELGKMVGSDKNNCKSTFVTLLGVEKSMAILKQRTKEAIKNLEIFGKKADFLVDMSQYLLKRTF